MAKESGQHKGHRQRMRARVEQYGLESLAPHEALEYVLYITNTRKDTNGLAHVLMDRFGDFAGVLDASEEDLLTVEGVGPSTARMLHLLPLLPPIPESSSCARKKPRPGTGTRKRSAATGMC